MEFVHQYGKQDDTIAAIATPPGEGGVAIIRISGKEAIAIANRCFSGDVTGYKSHTVHYGSVIDAGGRHIDDALLIPMRGPRSYTGEDTVEIHCHGGSLITRRVLATVLDAGARAAEPGEFTFRAFLNNKIDLSQAEAVQELIGAKNEFALNAAEAQLQGKLSELIRTHQQVLTETAAILEAWVDFPEEGLEFTTLEQLCADLESACSKLQTLCDTFHDGKIIHEGLSLCLIGRPNVGKSSLMNALLRKERAIVSDIPGTTRDIVEDQMRLGGLNLRLVDTAGIRDSDCLIEKEGIRRSQSQIAQADVILCLLDASQGLMKEDLALIESLPKQKTILIWNKIDLPHNGTEVPFPHVVSISAKENRGLDTLQKAIDALIWSAGPPFKEEVLITNIRHHEALQKAIQACRNVIDGLQNDLSPEFLSIEMRTCLMELGKIIGTNISEDILSAIFSKFCIGK